MRDAFAVLFFVSVGMLFDPIVFFQSSQLLIGTLLIILVGTPLVSFAAILAIGYPLRLALRVALSLAQIGEFSFIVGNLAMHEHLMSPEAMHVLVAASILPSRWRRCCSTQLNPLRGCSIDRRSCIH